MNNQETDWFSLGVLPHHEGVYKTRHRTHTGEVVEGFSLFRNKRWFYTEQTVARASKSTYPSTQQSREWKGLVNKP